MQHKFEMYVLVNKYVLSMLYNILQIKLVIKKNLEIYLQINYNIIHVFNLTARNRMRLRAFVSALCTMCLNGVSGKCTHPFQPHN